MQTIRYLAGGNTSQGFYSCFDHILPVRQRKRVYYIKGGPGVGKSTMMKRVGAHAQELGLEVEYFHCSSDPDSLDGVAVPQRGFAMMDGTAPHVYDPAVPGARDTLLSLGDYLDERALRPHAQDIMDVQRQISARFARCWRYLAAARQVQQAANAPLADEAKAGQLAQEWVHALPLRGGRGSIRRLFASGFTPQGRVDVTDFSAMQRCVTLERPFGAYATSLLRDVARRAAGRGLDVVELLDPLCPDETAHVLIPAHGVAFCTAEKHTGAGEWLGADALFPPPADDPERSFDMNACELLCQRAQEQLSAAKRLHDELEAYYVKNMDFLKWNTLLVRVLDELA